ncbi:hypothetical protein N8912_00005, partial [Rhodobacteraceae bacterium]|nr:hypothetical protein [Paracoccaceae bacterium]
HQTFKLKVGFDMAADISAVCAIQNGLSASEAIACDANQAWSVDQAQRFVTGITGVPLQWLEEPLPVFAQTTQWQSLAQSCRLGIISQFTMPACRTFIVARPTQGSRVDRWIVRGGGLLVVQVQSMV